MDFNQMKQAYNERYNNESYAGDADNQNVLAMFDVAEKLSNAAKIEFVQAFDFEFALGGEIYLGGKRTAAAKFPHLLAEGPAVGLNIITR